MHRTGWALVALGAMAASASHADAIDDCVLSTLKGGGADASVARMVHQTCQKKVWEEQDRALVAKYGTAQKNPLPVELVDRDRDAVRFTVRNVGTTTVLLVEAGFANPTPSGESCSTNWTRFVYRTELRPGSQGAFTAPIAELGNVGSQLCVAAFARRDRPSKWSDASWRAASPMPRSEVVALNEELSTRYAVDDPPAPSRKPKPGSMEEFSEKLNDMLRSLNPFNGVRPTPQYFKK